MKNKWNGLEVSIKHKVVSSHYYCKEAVIVRIEHGNDALRFEKISYGYQVSLNGESLFSVNEEEFCPTCGGNLRRGYGEQNLSMKDAMKISEKLNEKYEGIESAIEKITPLLGLLSDGDYMIADYDLFPCVGETHFWEFHAIPDLFTAWSSYYYRSKYSYNVIRPSHLIASERATLCNFDRVDYYMEHFCEEEAYPRAVGVLLSSNTVLLLDGHHKVAAATAKGKMAKCLVILPVEIEDKEKKTTILLQEDKYLLNDAGKIVGYADEFFGRKVLYETHGREIVKIADFSDWGEIPPKYKPDWIVYNEIPKDAYEYDIYSNIAVAKKCFQSECNYFLRKKMYSRAEVMFFLKEHQILNWIGKKELKDAWSGCVLRTEQMRTLNEAGYQLGLDKEPKTANLLYGMFSFLEGQIVIDEIPSVLLRKIETEKIKTILIPRTVKFVNKSIFKKFPDLKKIVVQEGNSYLREEDFADVLVKITQKREKESLLYYYPFAEIGKLLEEEKNG